MTVETATLISDLNASYPSATDPKSEGDNHIRLIKSALKATFPNVTGAVTATHAQLNRVDATSSIQTQLDSKLPKAGGTMTGHLTINDNATISGLLEATSALLGDATVYKSTNTAQRRIDFSHDSTLGYASIKVNADLSGNLQPLWITTSFSSSPNIVVSENANAFNGNQTITGNILHTGDYTTSGLVSATTGVTAKDSLLSATNTASSAKVYINDTSVVQDIPLSASTTRDLTIRGAYSASAPIPEGTVTIPSQLIAQSDIQATGSGKRFKADFSNATVANRFAFQTSTANGNTFFHAIPNGTASASGFIAATGSNATDYASAEVVATNAAAIFRSSQAGAGVTAPLEFNIGSNKCMRLDATTFAFTSVAGAIGYGTGAGGSANQPTTPTLSKSNPVALNKPSGVIAMNNAALSSGAIVSFDVNNSYVALYDGVVISMIGAAFTHGNYRIWVGNVQAGKFTVFLENRSGGSLSESVTFTYQVIKGSNA